MSNPAITLWPERALLAISSSTAQPVAAWMPARGPVSDDPDDPTRLYLSVDDNGPVEVTAQVLSDAPDLERDSSVEFSLLSVGGIILESPGGERQLHLTDVSGSYRIRLSRSQPPGVHPGRAPLRLHVELWPGDWSAPRLQGSWSGSTPRPEPATLAPALAERRAKGRSGADAVGRSLRERIADQIGAVTIRQDFDAAPGICFRRLANIYGWIGGSTSGADFREGERWFNRFDTDAVDGTWEIGGDGYVSGTYTSIHRPRKVIVSWNWFIGPHGQPLPYGTGTQVLPHGSMLTLQFDPREQDRSANASRHTAGTVLTLTHEQIPTAWVTSLNAFWSERLAHVAGSVE